jgi:biotin transport system substrate-specific component
MQTVTLPSSRAANLAHFATTLPGKILLGLGATAVVALAAHVSFPTSLHSGAPDAATAGGIGGWIGVWAGRRLSDHAGLPGRGRDGPAGLQSDGAWRAAAIAGADGRLPDGVSAGGRDCGRAARKLTGRTARFLAAFVAGNLAMAVLFLSGAGWFMHYTHHTLYAVWAGAVAPFLPGEFIKVLVAAGVYSTLSRAPRI